MDCPAQSLKRPVSAEQNPTKKHKEVQTNTQNRNQYIQGTLNSDTTLMVEHMNSIKHVFTGNEKEDLVVGHEKVKEAIEVAFIMMNLVEPPIDNDPISKHILIAGLGGLGKSVLLKTVASQVSRLIKKPISVFNIKASHLVSKYTGESEKAVDVLFATVLENVPSILCFDEVDGLIMKRTSDENDGSRRFKTSLLSEIRGTRRLDNVVILAATNKPDQLDENFVNRFDKKFVMALPKPEERVEIFLKFLRKFKTTLNEDMLDFEAIKKKTDGFSGNDIKVAVALALEHTVRIQYKTLQISTSNLSAFRLELEAQPEPAKAVLLPLNTEVLLSAVGRIKPSIDATEVKALHKWSQKYIRDA